MATMINRLAFLQVRISLTRVATLLPVQIGGDVFEGNEVDLVVEDFESANNPLISVLAVLLQFPTFSPCLQ